MFAVPSLLAAMTIAGAFWVGVLAARRLRDWGENNRALEQGDAPLALAAGSTGSGAPSDDPAIRKVRARVAERLQASLQGRGMAVSSSQAPREADELEIDDLRVGDVVMLDAIASPGGDVEGDFVIEGVLRLNEGSITTVVIVMADGERRRWLIGSRDSEEWYVVTPVLGHGLVGEPPRNVQPPGDSARIYGLVRRGQASVAAVGEHGRPGLSRVGTYLYRSGTRDVLWLERWGHEVLMGQGGAVARHGISFLPGG